MKDIAVITPVHELKDDTEKELLIRAINNVKACQKYYEHNLTTYIVTPLDLGVDKSYDCKVLINDGATDFCSQINFAAKNITRNGSQWQVNIFTQT